MSMYDPEKISLLYNEQYAKAYEAYYLHPWIDKHELNVVNLKYILDGIERGEKRWLDTCCGQAWHFSVFPDNTIEKTGVDISSAQIKLATRRNPTARFICDDITNVSLPYDFFDIVTNFWAAYCYLNSYDKIAMIISKVIQWTQKGGAIYFEILLPQDLRTFNESPYSHQTGFHVSARSADFSEWYYEDTGGRHNMLSPPIEFFLDRLKGNFCHVKAEHDKGFMTHLIATGKR